MFGKLEERLKKLDLLDIGLTKWTAVVFGLNFGGHKT
jgi:hypothetical protein